MASLVVPTSVPPASIQVSPKLPYSDTTRSQLFSVTGYPITSVNETACSASVSWETEADALSPLP